MAVEKLSQINNGGAINTATDKCVAVRSGTTDVLVDLSALSGGSPGGSSTNIQTNISGSFYGDDNLVYITADGSANYTTNLERWYKFDDGSGSTAVDSGSQAKNGTLHNTPTWITGHIGPYALQFASASSQYVSAADTGLPSGSSARTVSAWIKLINCTGEFILSYGTNAPGELFSLDVDNGGRFNFTGYSANSNGNMQVADGNWHFITVTYDGTNLKLYVDGQLDNSSPLTLNTTLSGTLYIGQALNGSDPWNGNIDDVRIYSGALTLAQIQTVYQYGLTTARIGVGTASPNYSLDVNGNGNLSGGVLNLGTESSAVGIINFKNLSNNNTLTIQSGATSGLFGNVIFTLPTADGSSGQYMQTDGSGNWSFTTPPYPTPGGSSGDVQFNNSGSFGGSSNLYWSGTALSIGTNSPNYQFTIQNTYSGTTPQFEVGAGVDLYGNPANTILFQMYNPADGSYPSTDWTAGSYRFGIGAANPQVVFDSSGNVGIGNTSPSYKLDVTGDVNFSGSLRVASDAAYIDPSGLLGINTADAPIASGDFRKITLTATDPTITSLAFDFTGSSYVPDYDGTIITRTLYEFSVHGGVTVYDATPPSATLTEYFNLAGAGTVENDNAGSYIASGQSFTYWLYAVYNGKVGSGIPTVFTDSYNDGSNFSVTINWSQNPQDNGGPTPDSIYVYNTTEATYTNVSSSTYTVTDNGDGSWTSGAPPVNSLNFNLAIGVTQGATGENYFLTGTNPNGYTTASGIVVDATGSSQTISDSAGWYVPTVVTPTSPYVTPSINTDGDANIGGNITVVGNTDAATYSVSGTAGISGTDQLGTVFDEGLATSIGALSVPLINDSVRASGLSSSNSSLMNFTNSITSAYMICGNIQVTAATTKTVQLTLVFTDLHGNSQTVNPTPVIGAVGVVSFNEAITTGPSTSVTLSSTVAGASGSIAYDVTAVSMKIQ